MKMVAIIWDKWSISYVKKLYWRSLNQINQTAIKFIATMGIGMLDAGHPFAASRIQLGSKSVGNILSLRKGS